MPLFYDAQITADGIRMPFLFTTRTKTIKFTQIKSIRKVSIWRAAFEGMNMHRPRMFSQPGLSRYVILIETKEGRLIVVRHKDEDGVVKLVSSHLPNSN